MDWGIVVSVLAANITFILAAIAGAAYALIMNKVCC